MLARIVPLQRPDTELRLRDDTRPTMQRPKVTAEAQGGDSPEPTAGTVDAHGLIVVQMLDKDGAWQSARLR